jgi:hypothetical protein
MKIKKLNTVNKKDKLSNEISILFENFKLLITILSSISIAKETSKNCKISFLLDESLYLSSNIPKKKNKIIITKNENPALLDE